MRIGVFCLEPCMPPVHLCFVEAGATQQRYPRVFATLLSSPTKRWLREQRGNRILTLLEARDFLCQYHQMRFKDLGGCVCLVRERSQVVFISIDTLFVEHGIDR